MNSKDRETFLRKFQKGGRILKNDKITFKKHVTIKAYGIEIDRLKFTFKICHFSLALFLELETIDYLRKNSSQSELACSRSFQNTLKCTVIRAPGLDASIRTKISIFHYFHD
jgi:hypothetical protein